MGEVKREITEGTELSNNDAQENQKFLIISIAYLITENVTKRYATFLQMKKEYIKQ